jgi:hypothetical protein
MSKETRLRVLRQQVARLEGRLAQLRQQSYRYSWVRLGVFGLGLIVAAAAFWLAGGWLFGPMLLAGLAAFGLAVAAHRRLNRSLARHDTWRRLKLAQLARMTLDWANIPALSGFQPQFEHPFEADLDLVGHYSLHRLLDVAVSSQGSARLRDWLTTPTPDLEVIRRRQQLVRELTPRSLFRDKLILEATVASGTRKMWDADRLAGWLIQPAAGSTLLPWLLLFGGLVGLNLILLGLNLLGLVGPFWQYGFALYFAALILANARLISGTFQDAAALQAALQQLAAVFHHLETFSYRPTPHLKTLCAPFLQSGARPSTQLARLGRVAMAAGLRENPIVWILLNAVFPWDIFVAHLLNQRRAELARHVPAWLEVWFELEALSSLANLAYTNPAYTMPELVPGQIPVLHAEGLGHPLIPDQARVNNSFSMADLGEVALITGSNMAGKSTFLRTVGVNLALAFAGGPVDAAALRTVPFRMFTCIKVTDSVTNGISYFYAEVKRLRALLSALEEAHPLPLFFFIDEIFRGTNNRERFIGSKAYIQTLAGQRGVGLISTHDLELARLAEHLPDIKNYHFRDEVAGDRMIFDYTLRPGPCPTTNALKIMQMEGLPV